MAMRSLLRERAKTYRGAFAVSGKQKPPAARQAA
jgi:hypothetical protein